MAIDQLTQIISTIPEAGHRGIDTQTAFVVKQEDFQDHLQGITVGELNTLKNQINSVTTQINTAVTTTNNNVTTTNNNVTTTNNNVTTTNNNVTTTNNNVATTAANVTKSDNFANAAHNVEVETGKYSSKHYSIEAANIVNTAGVNLLRADKVLAAKDVANMFYNASNKVTKVRYTTDTDTDYEVMTYNVNGKLSNVAHYIDGILKGNTGLVYSSGKLVSATFVAV